MFNTFIKTPVILVSYNYFSCFKEWMEWALATWEVVWEEEEEAAAAEVYNEYF